MLKISRKLLLAVSALATSFASNAMDCEPITVNMDTTICSEQILFGNIYSDPGTFKDTISGTTDAGCPIDTIWTINVVEISLKLRVFGSEIEICEGTPAHIEANLNASTPNGNRLTPTYYWDPEVPQNTLSPTLYLNKTLTYTIYADLDLPSDINNDAKGCHAKESITINVHKSPKLTIDSIDSQNGNVEVSIKEGTAPYQIFVDFNPISSTDDNLVLIEKLNNGDHVLQVIDNVGCSSKEDIEIKGTAVDDILADPSSNDNNYYNVNGQKVASPEKGNVYINKGKKIMYK